MSAEGSKDDFETYYSILGVGKTATADDIDKAYRRASLQVHPDKGGHPAAFLRVKKAHDVLKDPDLRERYDQYGSALKPSPGDLMGSGTIGQLVPLSTCAAGGAACQFFRVMGALDTRLWGIGCLSVAGGSWLRARVSNGRADTAVPAIVGGLVLGNVAGLCLGLGTRRTVRWVSRR